MDNNLNPVLEVLFGQDFCFPVSNLENKSIIPGWSL